MCCTRDTISHKKPPGGICATLKRDDAMSDCCCANHADTPEDDVRPVASLEASQPQDQACCCVKYKSTPRGEEFQANLQRRLNRAIGQLNGVKAMIDDNRYCGDVLTQLSAAESAVHRVSEMILRNHMQTCVVEQIRAGHDEVVDEAMDLIHRFGGR